MKKRVGIMLLFAAFWANNSYSQEGGGTATKEGFKPSTTQFMVRGYGHSGLDYTEVDGESESTYTGATFAPIFLFKHGDKLMFESELEFELEEGEVNVGFEYADVMYIVNDYMTVRAGKFLLPFGTFMERLHPAWINRLSTKPLGFGHGGIAPSSGVGLEVRGAFNVGSSKINYSVYTTNGPALKDVNLEPEEAGQLRFNNFEDNNNNKALGGRIGFLPFSNSSVEIGGSVYTGTVGNREDSLYGNIGAVLFAGDFSFVKQIPAIKGIVDIKAQFMQSNVDNATYFDAGDTVGYTFDNSSQAYFAQLSYRPSMVGNKFLKNIEVVGRYSTLTTPTGSLWQSEQTQMSFGLNYWMSWRSVIKFTYEVTNITAGDVNVPGNTSQIKGFYAHWALGF